MVDHHCLRMDVLVHNRRLLMETATAHANRHGASVVVKDAAAAIVMLLHPAKGGDAYTGSLQEAGIEIVDSNCVCLGKV